MYHENPFEWLAESSRRKQGGPFLFFLPGDLIITQAPLCLLPTSPPLDYLTFLLSTSPPHESALCAGPNASFFPHLLCFSTASLFSLVRLFSRPPPGRWIAASLLSCSFPLPSPALPLHYWLLSPNTLEPKSSSVSLDLLLFQTTAAPWKKLETLLKGKPLLEVRKDTFSQHPLCIKLGNLYVFQHAWLV